MPVDSRTITIKTKGFSDILDLTPQVRSFIGESAVKNGIAAIFVPGSTAGITTIEFEEGALHDLQEAVERLIPRSLEYAHDRRWGDGNGFSHVRAAILGSSLSVPVHDGLPLLGTWQQIVLIDFDNRPRSREVVFQLVGE
jgi:secondary thiamine-phosphate synthase enzyme